MRGILLPVIVLTLTAILGVLIIGPLGNLLGDLLGSTIAAINNFARSSTNNHGGFH